MKLISITKSPRPGKKWRATFEHTGDHGVTEFHTDFGDTDYLDFTQGASPERAALYRMRHQKDLDTNNPTKAGYLSYYLLWSSPHFKQNILKYKNKFHL